MADHNSLPGARGDEAELFRAFNHVLMQTVSSSLYESTPQNVEDACAFAWAQFLEHQPDRSMNWQGWLFRTAQRQAWLLERQARETKPLRAFDWEDHRETVQGIAPDMLGINRDVQDAFSLMATLAAAAADRADACTRAALHRHQRDHGPQPDPGAAAGVQANEQMYDLLAERSHATDRSSPRAERLWELENDTPEWLTRRIGRVPRPSRRHAGHSVQRREWRRAAIALDDYRKAAGPVRFDESLDSPTRDPELSRLRQTALRAVQNLEHSRDREHRRGLDE
jgi:hypothetical protein